jgi:hypothetical protein
LLEDPVNQHSNQITLTLEGEQARKGVSLDAFDAFIDHFTTALRYHYRASRFAEVKKTGHPFAEERLVTAFRLVEFRIGSGVAVLEPPLTEHPEPLLADIGVDLTTLAWTNVAGLLDALQTTGDIDRSVARELEAATKALGKDGRFTIDYRSQTDQRRVEIYDARLAPLLTPESDLEGGLQAITGVLHSIDLEPDKVGIRTASGLDWTCRYPSHLEKAVGAMLGARVWVCGSGKATSARAGSLDITEIQLLPEFEQTELFTGEPVALGDLMKQQGIDRPQGLDSLADPDWEAGVESDLFLAALLDDTV